VISYQKQIIGRELSTGVFDFLNGNIFDVGVGGRAQEPIQLAVRSVIERAVLEMSSNLYGSPSQDMCGESPNFAALTNGKTGDFARGSSSIEDYNAVTRSNPSHGHDRRDKALKAALRGTK